MESCYAFTSIPPWLTHYMEITLDVTTKLATVDNNYFEVA